VLRDVRAAECFNVIGVELLTDDGSVVCVSPREARLEISEEACASDFDVDMSVRLGRDSALGCKVVLHNEKHPLAGIVAKIQRNYTSC